MSEYRLELALATALLLATAACGGDHEQEATLGDAGTTSTARAASTGAGERGTFKGAVLPDAAGTGTMGTTGTSTGTTGGPTGGTVPTP